MTKIKGNFNKAQQALIDKHNWIIDSERAISSSKVQERGDYVTHLSNCLVSITPVKHEEPIQLFGLKHKVLTSNKISVYETLVHKENKADIKKGNLLLEVIISDEELAQALMDDGSRPRVATISHVEGQPIDISNVLPMQNSVSQMQDKLENNVRQSAIYFEESLDKLKDELQKTRPSKKALESIIVGLSSHSHNIKDSATYNISVLAEHLTKDINTIDFELMTTAQKLMFYKNSENLNLLDYKGIEKNDPFPISFIKGHFDERERRDYVSLLTHVNQQLKNDDIEKTIKKYKPSEGMKPEKGEITDATITFKQTYGQVELAHINNIAEKAFYMTISNAKIYNRSRYSIGEGKEFIRIYFDTNDLIRLMRGSEHSSVQGTILRYAGQSVPTVKLQDYVEDKINLKDDFKGNNLALLAVTKQIVDILKAGSFKKSTKDELLALIQTAEKVNDKTAKDIIKQGFETQSKVVDLFQNEMEQRISKTLQGLPNHVVKESLKLLKK